MGCRGLRAARIKLKSMEFVLKHKNYVVIYKPAGLPSQSDLSGDKDAMTLTSEELFSQGECGQLYLVHRLDRVVGGLLIFARNKKTAAELSRLVSGEGIGKEYLAVIDGFLEGGSLKDLIYKDARASKAFVVERERSGVKSAELEFTPVSTVHTEKGDKTLVKIRLKTGRFHQIRVQFALRKAPICGDGKYGSKDNLSKMPALFSYRLSTEIFGEKILATRLPDLNEYPWSLFDKELYGEL